MSIPSSFSLRLRRSLYGRRAVIATVAAATVLHACTPAETDLLATQGSDIGFSFVVSSAQPVVIKYLGDNNINVTITRLNGYNGPIQLVGEYATAGTLLTDITVAPVTVPAGATTATLVATATARPGIGTLTLYASASNYRSVSVDVPITAVNVGSFSIGVNTAPITIASPGTAKDSLMITRVKYIGAINFTATSDPGIRVSTDFGFANGSVMPFDIDVDRGVSAGTHVVTVTATGYDLPNAVTTTFAVIVVPASYNLNVKTAPLTVGSPGVQKDTIDIVRSNFAGAIAVTAVSDSSIIISPMVGSPTGNQLEFTVSVAPGVSTGTHTVTLTGTAVGLANVVRTFAVVVAPGASTVALDVVTQTGFRPLLPTGESVNVGATLQLRSIVKNAAGVAFLDPVTFVSSNTAVATATNPGTGNSIITGLAPGTATITVTSTAKPSVSASVTIIVNSVATGGVATRIVLTSPNISGYIHPGDQLLFTGKAVDANGNVASNCPVGMATDESAIATMPAATRAAGISTALATGVAPGTTVVRAYCTDATSLAGAAARLTVADQIFGVTQVNVTPRYIYLPLSTMTTSFQFAATVVQNAGGASAPVSWDVDPAGSPVTVSATGLVSVTAATGPTFGGGRVITATAMGQTDIGWITYGNAGSIKGTMVSTSGQYLGGSTATATPTDGGTPVSTTINNEGVFYLVGLAPGSYTVFVRQQGNPAGQNFSSVVVTVGGTTVLNLAPFL